MNVYDALALMMKVPGHATDTVFFEIDTWLSPRNKERQRALEAIKRQVPAEVHPILGYMHTEFDTQKKIGRWMHTFLTHQSDKIGWTGKTYFEEPCLIAEITMPRIFITAQYNDPKTRINYQQNAEFYPRRSQVNLGPIITRKMKRNEPLK